MTFGTKLFHSHRVLIKLESIHFPFTPSSGKRKSAVQIAGTAFGTVSGQVWLGVVPVKVTAWSNGSITFTVPSGMTYATYPITVVNSQGQALLPRAFTVVR
ncbi:MAG: IPT/TIG domain-containing protein [Syntrophobacteraceae bacterium]|jgi:hypothetical protein